MRRRTLISASLGLGALAGLSWLGGAGARGGDALPAHTRSGRAFGTGVTLTVLHPDAAVAGAALDDAFAQIAAIDALMSLYRADSQVARLNRLGVLDAPDPRLRQALEVAQQLSLQTAGAFDVTVQPLWLAFAAAQARGGLPTPQALAQARAQVGWQRLAVSAQRLQLLAPGMAITLNGLAQGYAADLALQALRSGGIAHALLDTGESAAIGDKAGGAPWVLGVRHPRDPAGLAARLRMDGRAVATSGDYETVFSADFMHHHIFDPASGDSPTALASATVLAPSGILADGLSTAFMVLGAEPSLRLAARLDGVDTLLIGKDGGRWQSPGLPLLTA